MRKSILDKRRAEGWLITIWGGTNSVICQITTPSEFDDSSPVVDVACIDFQTALKFARSVCRRTQRAVDTAADLVFNWHKTTPETFIALVNSCSRQRR
jgi:hypothetical protein